VDEFFNLSGKSIFKVSKRKEQANNGGWLEIAIDVQENSSICSMMRMYQVRKVGAESIFNKKRLQQGHADL